MYGSRHLVSDWCHLKQRGTINSCRLVSFLVNVSFMLDAVDVSCGWCWRDVDNIYGLSLMSVGWIQSGTKDDRGLIKREDSQTERTVKWLAGCCWCQLGLMLAWCRWQLWSISSLMSMGWVQSGTKDDCGLIKREDSQTERTVKYVGFYFVE